jgi:SOS-response transcriptional repressor LexA
MQTFIPVSTFQPMPKFVNNLALPNLPQGYAHAGQWIEDIRRDLNLSPKELEVNTNALGEGRRIERSYYERIESGAREPWRVSLEKLEALRVVLRQDRPVWEERLGVTIPSGVYLEPEFFSPQKDEMGHLRANVNFLHIPRIGVVNAGKGDEYKLATIGEVDEVPHQALIKKQCRLQNCFSYHVNGDSMFSEGAKTHRKSIAHGDVVVIEKYRTVQTDDLVVIWDKVSQKMLIKAVSEADEDGFLVFSSYNKGHPPLIRRVSEVKIYGVVVWRGG